MRRTIGLLLATTGLAFMVAGCASTSGGGAGTMPAATTTASQAGQQTASVGTSAIDKDFKLRVKCPGIHEEKAHGWSDQQIMAQESVDEADIPACVSWVENQPKGYVPPPPAGFVPKVPAAKGAAGASGSAPATAPASH